MNSKYPWQIATVKRPKKILSIDAKFFLPGEQENVSPLEMHSGYSRCVVTIIDSSGSSVMTPKANIVAGDIASIKFKTECAIQEIMKGARATIPNDEIIGGPAYTQKLMDKNYKGKTPAEILLKDPNEKDGLLRARNWLQSNLARYPGNKAQIEAIDEAIQLMEIGELRPCQPQENLLTIYNTENKYFTTKNERGFNQVYKISVMCDPSKNYPFVLNIMNCFAPVESLPDGKRNIKMSEAIDTVKSSISMSVDEWYSIIDRILTTMRNFETINFAQQFKLAYDNSFHHS